MSIVQGRQKNQHTFTINFKSKETDETHYGSFTCKRLSVADHAEIGVMRARLNGNMHYDSSTPGCGVSFETDIVNYQMALLQKALIASPEWWDLENIFDLSLLLEVSKEVKEFQDTFRVKRQTAEGLDSRSSGQGNSEVAQSQTIRHGNSGEMVGQEVQTALEP